MGKVAWIVRCSQELHLDHGLLFTAYAKERDAYDAGYGCDVIEKIEFKKILKKKVVKRSGQ